jgi:hypothetical protein
MSDNNRGIKTNNISVKKDSTFFGHMDLPKKNVKAKASPGLPCHQYSPIYLFSQVPQDFFKKLC